ncbi:MAG: serine/threonine protein kinase [Thermoleophilaceae bacterium]|nr:serine/threonine protein kinase [Thermoleophilaceae bacterium]
MTPEVDTGTEIDGRYRILNRIGSGGMADVYLAEDSHLGRQVALKVLHRRFAQDSEFVERFRREASSAAGLQHPNVVNVFDRGDHDGTYYIAMEYLDGRTLKDVLSQDGPLDQTRAIDIALQVLQAAAFAHRRGVIHRDFKPHNVMLDSADGVKVTDFGIARAGASEMTETGSIMGTAQYLSPEQAQGHAVTAASDLYSIGVMLYEMVAGRLPFTGDTAVSIALHHMNDPPPPIRDARPDVNPSLEAVIARALAKDPAQRFGDADEFTAALLEARNAIAEGHEVGENTAVWGAAFPPEEAVEEVAPKKRRRFMWLIPVILILGALGLAYALTRPDTAEVPNVVRQPEAAARVTLEKAGFEVAVTRAADRAVPAGQVISTDPAAGEDADKGAKVNVSVSSGPEARTIPRVSGQSAREAERELIKAGFTVERGDDRSSTDRKRGEVIYTTPRAGQEAPVGSRVVFYVSSGPPQVTVPDVVGVTEGSAESQLGDEGLLVARKEMDSDQPEGTVIAQDPAAGEKIDKGSRVTITVSKGEQPVDVPDVEGIEEDRARSQLSGAGFKVRVIERSTFDEAEDGVVIEQRPASGQERTKGATVTIFVGALDTSSDPVEPEIP